MKNAGRMPALQNKKAPTRSGRAQAAEKMKNRQDAGVTKEKRPDSVGAHFSTSARLPD
jgi:hypothetical protein